MSDTIYRDSAIDAIANDRDICVQDRIKAVEILDGLPSVQPEIIKCKDCIHRKKDEIFGDQWCHGRKINDDWYCADAERREG